MPDALHSNGSLLSTPTNVKPHDKFSSFPRKSIQRVSLPSWLSPGSVLLRKFVRSNKQDGLVEEVELTHLNPTYAHIRYTDGRASTVSLSDLAPCPKNTSNIEHSELEVDKELSSESQSSQSETIEIPASSKTENDNKDIPKPVEEFRRSTRLWKRRERYGFQDD